MRCSTGADAVYCALPGVRHARRAAQLYGLGTAGRLHLRHARGRRVYLTLNTLPTNEELARLPAAIEQAAAAGVDAFIIADLGVLRHAQKYAPGVDIHFSTQAGIANYAAAAAAMSSASSGVVLARELSLPDIRPDPRPRAAGA